MQQLSPVGPQPQQPVQFLPQAPPQLAKLRHTPEGHPQHASVVGLHTKPEPHDDDVHWQALPFALQRGVPPVQFAAQQTLLVPVGSSSQFPDVHCASLVHAVPLATLLVHAPLLHHFVPPHCASIVHGPHSVPDAQLPFAHALVFCAQLPPEQLPTVVS